MEKAKAAVSGILNKAGHHDTTVHESVAPAVQKETVNEHRREEQQVVKDREVHQDHHHTTVQPINHQEVLPEQHHHKQVGVEHRTHDHRDHDKTQQHLQHEAAQFKNESVRAPTAHTTSTSVPEVTGEHVHHHVHEKIQPVVHKQTIEPHVVHTTVPVHETHHNAAQHHTTSALPAVNMSDFSRQGGHLGGHGEEVHHFKGEPQNLTQNLGQSTHIGSGQHTGTGIGGQHTGTGIGGQHTGTGIGGQHTGTGIGGQHTGTGIGGQHTGTGIGGQHTGTGIGGQHTGTGIGGHNTTGTGLDGKMGSTHHDNTATEAARHATSGQSGHAKPSLLDKLNPMKDSDGDGKAGFMK